MPSFCSNCGSPMGEGQKYCRQCGRQTKTEDLSSAEPSKDQPVETIVFGGSEVNGFSSNASADAHEIKTRIMEAVDPPVAATVDLSQGKQVVNTDTIEPASPSEELRPAGDVTGPIAHATGPVRAHSTRPMLLPAAILIGVIILAAGGMLAYRFADRSSGSAAGEQQTANEAENAGASNANDSQSQAYPDLSLDLGNSNESRADNSNRSRRGNENRASGKAGDEGDRGGSSPGDAETTAAASPEPQPPVSNSPDVTEAPPKKEETRPSAEQLKKSGLESLGKKEFAEAAARFRAALRLRPSDDDLHYLLAMAYERQGLFAEALAEYRECRSGTYAPLAAQHVKRLMKKLEKK